MTITATSIFNRAGTAHLWMNHATSHTLVRSWCGLVEKRANLDALSWIKECSKCQKRRKSKI